jgi:hypothetical protein
MNRTICYDEENQRMRKLLIPAAAFAIAAMTPTIASASTHTYEYKRCDAAEKASDRETVIAFCPTSAAQSLAAAAREYGEARIIDTILAADDLACASGANALLNNDIAAADEARQTQAVVDSIIAMGPTPEEVTMAERARTLATAVLQLLATRGENTNDTSGS